MLLLRRRYFLLVVFLSFASACLAAEPPRPKADRPKLAPLPAKVPAPQNNPTTAAKVALGRQLFFDPRLSGDNNISCATCHIPEKGFADGKPTGTGAGGAKLKRNTPTTLNAAFLTSYTWDGRADSLEQQALGPIQAADEMNQNLAELERELQAVPGYARQFREAFGTAVTREAIARALAAYERTLLTRRSPLDRYLAGEKDALSASARRGMELFTGDAGCIRCHNGPVLSDGKFYRLGVSFLDEGRGAVTDKREDRFKFRTPPLRDVARTAPYMHDGSRRTLEEVIEFYFRGVSTSPPDGLPLDVEPLVGQSYSDIGDLAAFLRSLSGELPDTSAPELP